MMGLRERIESDGITAEVSWRGQAPDHAGDWGSDASWYDVTLSLDGRSMTVPFGMGAALTDEPDAADVLNCLASDASGYENAWSFEDWAAEYGYDTDSRSAERTYGAVEGQTLALRAFLGADLYEAYLWDTEGL